MNRLAKTLVGIGGSLAVLGMLVNWHIHFAGLSQWTSAPVPAIGALVLLGWLLRKAWLRLPAELGTGFFSAWVAWQLVQPILPTEPNDTNVARLALAACLGAFLSLAGYLSVERWAPFLDAALQRLRPFLRLILAGALLAALFFLCRADLAVPYSEVLGLALAAALWRSLVFKAPARFMDMAALAFAAFFSAQDLNTGDGNQALQTGAVFLAPLGALILAASWERLAQWPRTWTTLLAVAALLPLMLGIEDTAWVEAWVLALAAAWWGWRLRLALDRPKERGGLPDWVRDLGPALDWAVDLAVALGLLSLCGVHPDPLRAGWVLDLAQDHLLLLLFLTAMALRGLAWSVDLDVVAALGCAFLVRALSTGLGLSDPFNLMAAAAILALLEWRRSHPVAWPGLLKSWGEAPWGGAAAIGLLCAWLGAFHSGWYQETGRTALLLILAAAGLRLLLKRPAAVLAGISLFLVTVNLGAWILARVQAPSVLGLLPFFDAFLFYVLWESIGEKVWTFWPLAAALVLPMAAFKQAPIGQVGAAEGAQVLLLALLAGLRYAAPRYVGWLASERVQAWKRKLKNHAWVKRAKGTAKGLKGLKDLDPREGLDWIRAKRHGLAKAGVAAAALLLLWGGWMWWRGSSCVVESFTPSGLVSSPNTMLQVRFSKPVFARSGDLSGAITVDPPLPGAIRLLDDHTLVLEPSQALAPSTNYHARMDSSKLDTHAFRMEGSAGTSFSTEPFAVKSLRLYYNWDLLHQNEVELVGECDFNYPVSEADFRRALAVSRQGETQGVSVEKGLLPTRYVFKVAGFTRQESAQTFKVTLAKGLLCENCGLGLAQDYESTISLDALPRFELADVQLHHEPGRSLVAVQFSLPVTEAEVKSHLSVARVTDSGKLVPVPFDVESEYAYAVISADFLPNVTYRIVVNEQMRCKTGRLIETTTAKDASGQLRRQDLSRDVQVQDAPPKVEFQDAGHYLPRDGSRLLAVRTTNLDGFTVTAFRVFKNNLVHYLRDSGLNGYDDGRYGMDLRSRELPVKGGQINEEITTQVDLARLYGGKLDGLYNVTVNSPQHDTSGRTWVLATDIGLVATRAGKDLWVQALSIGSLAPKPNVLVEVYSRENQVLHSGRTDLEGRLRIADIDATVDDMQPFLVVASDGEDLSFLHLNHNPLSVSRFDTGGDPVSKEGFEAFLSSDRGLYRPGDAVNLTSILRRFDLARADQPVELKVLNPEGKESLRVDLQPDAEGMATVQLPLKADAMTGEYQAVLALKGRDNPLTQAAFKVEEFIPNKITANIELPRSEAQSGGKIEYGVRVLHLFGAPAAALNVKTEVELVPGRFEHPDYPGYRFVDGSRDFTSETLRVPKGVTDGKGAYPVSLEIPTSILPGSMILGNVYAEVLDEGGRPVGAHATIRIHRYPYYLGLKSLVGNQVEPGTRVQLSLVAIDPGGKRQNLKGVPITVTRKRWYSVFRKHGWRGDFESSFYEEVVDARRVDIKGQASFGFVADKEGDYTVLLGDESGMRSSLDLTVQGRASGEEDEVAAANLKDPGTLVLKLDKNEYRSGDTAQVQVNAPFAGRLLLSEERDSVFERRSVLIPAGRSVVPLPVGAALNPNAYVVGLLLRKPSENLRQLPMVSFGVAPLAMDARDRKVDLGWAAPASVTSQQGLNVDLSTGEPGAKVVVAAVDEGILQIISFATPDPFAYFYRKRRLETQVSTFWDEVLPDLQRKEAVGGDEDEGFERRHLNPVAAQRVKSFARYSGVLTADAAGKVHVAFPTEDFQGEARVMAMAVKGSKFGSRAWHVKVADPIVLEAHLPRFLAPGDLFTMPVRVFNQTDKKAVISLSLQLSGPIEATGKPAEPLSIDPKAEKGVDLDLRAKGDAGVAVVQVTALTADGASYVKRTELAVRPGQPLSTDMLQGSLAPGAEVKLPVPGDFIPFGRLARIHLSANPLYEFIGALRYLVQYPYGCAEQMTSQAFPMLALKGSGLLGGAYNLASGSGGGDAKAEADVQAAIRALAKQQMPDGTFSLWPGGEGEAGYLSDYVSQFMLEAKRAGFDVDNQVLDRIRQRIGAIQVPSQAGRLDRSQQNVAERPIFDPYRFYLRALSGNPDREGMRAMLADQPRMRDLAVFDRCLLAMAFAETGDADSARRSLPKKEAVLGAKLYREAGGSWNSSQRDLAGYLLALARSGAGPGEMDPIVDEMRKRMKDGHFGSTQEDAWTFLALSQALKRYAAERPLRADWRLGQGPAQSLAAESTLLGDEQGLFGKTVTVTNRGDGPLAYTLLAEGTRLAAPTQEDSQGMSLRRVYRDEQGKEINLGSVTQGQLVVVTVEVACKRPVENLVVVDLLPAGFEVDNPRLQSQGRLGFDPPNHINAAYTDIRDDRILLFTQDAQDDLSFSYSVRAVSPGTFQVPALLAEAMYDPEIHGRFDYKDKLVVVPNRY